MATPESSGFSPKIACSCLAILLLTFGLFFSLSAAGMILNIKSGLANLFNTGSSGFGPALAGCSYLLNQQNSLPPEQLKQIIIKNGPPNAFYRRSNPSDFEEIVTGFIQTGQNYGISNVYIAAHAAHESSWGLSTIARQKKNLFGWEAYDRNPVELARSFSTYQSGIEYVIGAIAQNYLSPSGRYYFDESQFSQLSPRLKDRVLNIKRKNGISRINGGTLEAMNVYYARDDLWASKIKVIMNEMFRAAGQQGVFANDCGGLTDSVFKGPIEPAGRKPEIPTGNKKDLIEKALAHKCLTDQNGEKAQIKQGIIRSELLRTLIAVADFACEKGFKIRISSLKSDHSTYAKSGNISNHHFGLAADIGNESIAPQLLPWLKENSQTLRINELIFDSQTIGKSSNSYNLKQGKHANYDSKDLSDHRDHIHLSVLRSS